GIILIEGQRRCRGIELAQVEPVAGAKILEPGGDVRGIGQNQVVAAAVEVDGLATRSPIDLKGRTATDLHVAVARRSLLELEDTVGHFNDPTIMQFDVDLAMAIACLGQQPLVAEDRCAGTATNVGVAHETEYAGWPVPEGGNVACGVAYGEVTVDHCE